MRRAGSWLAFLGSAALLGVLVALLARSQATPAPGKEPLLVYCGAGLRLPVESAARAYEQATGVQVQLQFGPSQTLLASIEASKKGDLYLPGDDAFLKLAREKGLLEDSIPLARMRPVLAFRKGSPKAAKTLEELLAGDAKIAMANPEAAAVGKVVREALAKGGAWERLQKRVAVTKPTVNEVANDLKLGTVDAGFVWDATVAQYPELVAVELAELSGSRALVSAGVLKTAGSPPGAFRFARWLAARDRGQADFSKAGFEVVGGDAWSDEPKVLIYAGAMLRPAIAPTIAAFERREGVRVNAVFDGCGILVAAMKTKERPDLYFACDESFMKEVQDLFGPAQPVSINQLVILTPKGNPHGIKDLNGLGKPGLRVGVGHEKQCALGALTKETLIQSKQYDRVRANVKVEAPTGDLLVNSLLTGSLDAVIAYVSNAAASGDKLEGIAVDIPCALAVQPVAVGKDSPRAQMAGRLLESFRSEESRQRFLSEGFRWKGGP